MAASKEAQIDVIGPDQIALLLRALGARENTGSAVDGEIDRVAVKVRNRAFQGKNGGRVVKLQGSASDLPRGAAVILSVLCNCQRTQDWASFIDCPAWGYADPVEEKKVHAPFAMSKIIQWRQSGPFTDSQLLQHEVAKCWVPLWLAAAMHSLPSPASGAQSIPMQQSASALPPPPLPEWDDDEIMEDLEGQDVHDMTEQLAHFRQPGQSLHQYADFMDDDLPQPGGLQLPDAMDVAVEGQRQLTLVVDTNVLVEKLVMLQQICSSFQTLVQDEEANILASIVIPSIVLAELDGLKKSNSSGRANVAMRSRQALRWLEKAQQGKDSVVKGQSAADRKKAASTYSSIGLKVTNDDLVLFCALHLRDQLPTARHHLAAVHLLSDDRNLRVKAQSEQLSALAFEDAPCTVSQAIDICLDPTRENSFTSMEEQLVSQLDKTSMQPSTSAKIPHDNTSADMDMQPHLSTRQHSNSQLSDRAASIPQRYSNIDRPSGSLPHLRLQRSDSGQGSQSGSPWYATPHSGRTKIPTMAGKKPGSHESLVRQMVETALVPQMLWKLQEDEWWVKEPELIVSHQRPWSADIALQIFANQWGTFQELIGPRNRQALQDVKALRRLLGGRKSASSQDAHEAAQLLLSLLHAIGAPEPREDNNSPDGGASDTVTWQQARDALQHGCKQLEQLLDKHSDPYNHGGAFGSSTPSHVHLPNRPSFSRMEGMLDGHDTSAYAAASFPAGSQAHSSPFIASQHPHQLPRLPSRSSSGHSPLYSHLSGLGQLHSQPSGQSSLASHPSGHPTLPTAELHDASAAILARQNRPERNSSTEWDDMAHLTRSSGGQSPHGCGGLLQHGSSALMHGLTPVSLGRGMSGVANGSSATSASMSGSMPGGFSGQAAMLGVPGSHPSSAQQPAPEHSMPYRMDPMHASVSPHHPVQSQAQSLPSYALSAQMDTVISIVKTQGLLRASSDPAFGRALHMACHRLLSSLRGVMQLLGLAMSPQSNDSVLTRLVASGQDIWALLNEIAGTQADCPSDWTQTILLTIQAQPWNLKVR